MTADANITVAEAISGQRYTIPAGLYIVRGGEREIEINAPEMDAVATDAFTIDPEGRELRLFDNPSLNLFPGITNVWLRTDDNTELGPPSGPVIVEDGALQRAIDEMMAMALKGYGRNIKDAGEEE